MSNSNERKCNKLNLFLRKIKQNIAYIFYDMKTMKEGQIVHITVCDCFTGEVRILKNHWNKWFVEIIDVTMCYPQLVPCEYGETMWIHRRDLYRDDISDSVESDTVWVPY